MVSNDARLSWRSATYLMLSDRLADLIRKAVEDLAIVVARDVVPEAAKDPGVRARDILDGHRLEAEGRGEVGLEERLEDLVGQHDHAESTR
ncbi:hypothetical protein NUW54_g14702 [Trametes sanguinea]|uniref:Uncharacterized protein n=1 Tax=Trametes sanguinea TaxID=158606 RepID=A0ACC1MAP7_9APHY|nr:hypothetical protein NUW54_g14702 [Trametes sanguinea]